MNSDWLLKQLKILLYFDLGCFSLHKKWAQRLLSGSELHFIACRIESARYVDHLTLEFFSVVMLLAELRVSVQGSDMSFFWQMIVRRA